MPWTYTENTFHGDFPKIDLSVRLVGGDSTEGILEVPVSCPYCVSFCSTLDYRQQGWVDGSFGNIGFPESEEALYVCQKCGWWCVLRTKGSVTVPSTEYIRKNDIEWYELPNGSYKIEAELLGITSILKELDLTDMNVPLDEINRYLITRYKERNTLPPRRVEEVVNSVFKSQGLSTILTQSSKDKGIDIFVFEKPGNRLVGVQVKRWKNKIEAASIDQFYGALVRNNAAAGIFITFSSFTKGAKKYAGQFTKDSLRPIPIELWDAERFYDALELTMSPAYRDPNEYNTPFFWYWKGNKGDYKLLDTCVKEERDEFNPDDESHIYSGSC